MNNRIINCFDGTYSKDQLKKWSKKKNLLCPVCGKPYEYCHGKIKIPYFRHLDKTICDIKYSEPETDEHLKGKRDLYQWMKKQDGVTDITLEGWIAETKQRPDIMFKYEGKQYVIEYQCSPISGEYLERHELYEAAGISDIWICGAKKYIQYYHKGPGDKRLNILEKNAHIYYNPETKHIYSIDNIDKLIFEKITKQKNKRLNNLMRNPFDYRVGKSNYIFVKDRLKNYSTYSFYPSPTGRSSRKYPYPVTYYDYSHNVALATCLVLENLKLKGIK